MLYGVFWYFPRVDGRLEVIVAHLALCFDGVLAQKVYALLLQEPVSFPLYGHRSSDLLSKGSRKRGNSCCGSHFPSSSHWLLARTPMLLEKQVASRPSRWVVCQDHFLQWKSSPVSP